MRLLLVVILAVNSVRTYDNNNFVVEVPEDSPIQAQKPFKVYWNVPTGKLCSSKKIFFENLYERFGIIQNKMDLFEGDQITILYDRTAGQFPALFKLDNGTNEKYWKRNGGLPQEGNLKTHLEKFQKDLDVRMPDKNFSGIGVIDFEEWMPIFRQNWGRQISHRNVSHAIERQLHPHWNNTQIKDVASQRFEKAARVFLESTLQTAKRLRPNALWGYYGFPYCYNKKKVEDCSSDVRKDNDQLEWLWLESTVFCPSVYNVKVPTSELTSLIRGRIREAARCAKGRAPILPYFWFRYRDGGFMTEMDLEMVLSTIYHSDAVGLIIWGGWKDVNNVTKCQKLLDYVEEVLGPAIAKYTKLSNKRIDENDMVTTTLSSINTVTTETPLFNDISESNTNKVTNGSDEVSNINNVLMDLILHSILSNVQSNISNIDVFNDKNYKNNQLGSAYILQNTEVHIETSLHTSKRRSIVVTNTNNNSLNAINKTTVEENMLIMGNKTYKQFLIQGINLDHIKSTNPQESVIKNKKKLIDVPNTRNNYALKVPKILKTPIKSEGTNKTHFKNFGKSNISGVTIPSNITTNSQDLETTKKRNMNTIEKLKTPSTSVSPGIRLDTSSEEIEKSKNINLTTNTQQLNTNTNAPATYNNTNMNVIHNPPKVLLTSINPEIPIGTSSDKFEEIKTSVSVSPEFTTDTSSNESEESNATDITEDTTTSIESVPYSSTEYW